MKLGAAYIVFDGIELLEYSIKQIREHIDYLVVIYQEKSWFGKSLKKEDFELLKSLQKSKLIDELISFNSFAPLSKKDSSSILKAKGFERAKRQYGLSKCLARGCTHYLCMDVDEFYVNSEFLKAKQEIIKNGYESTAVRYINYVNLPTLHRGIDPSRVPFICKISPNTRMGSPFFVKCDPTRGILNGLKKTHDFSLATIKMHHMETVRKDLFAKYDSTTRSIFDRSRTTDLVKSIKSLNSNSKSFDFKKIIFPSLREVKLVPCENLFEIPYVNWQKNEK